MLVYIRDGYAETIVCAATLREKLQIKLVISPSHSVLTPGGPAPELTWLLEREGDYVGIYQKMLYKEFGLFTKLPDHIHGFFLIKLFVQV